MVAASVGLPSSSAVVGVTGWALARGAAWRVVVADVVGWPVAGPGSCAVAGWVLAADVVWPVGLAGSSGPSGLVGPSGRVGLVGAVGAVEGDGGALDVQFPAVVVEAAVMA
jgi:hypothetical protein